MESCDLVKCSCKNTCSQATKLANVIAVPTEQRAHICVPVGMEMCHVPTDTANIPTMMWLTSWMKMIHLLIITWNWCVCSDVFMS